MKTSAKIGTGLLFVAIGVGAGLAHTPAVEAASFTLTSTAFKNNGAIAPKYSFNQMGCTGENVSPPLEWKNPPAGTKSFALMVHDPDAPTGSGWWHWVVTNIPADTTALPEGAGAADGHALPKGTVQGNTDFGKPGWGGPCPPPGSGKHHYNFMLYALKVDKIDVPPGASPAMVGFNVNANKLGQAKLTGTFEQKKK
jgi:Raf kinase inhibitor-like YbhB/YbcL family protein